MAEAIELGPDDRVLEIGAGSGYAAAVLSRIATEVFTVERHPELAETAAERLKQLGYDNVRVLCGDGTRGWPEEAPFDGSLSAGSWHTPACWSAPNRRTSRNSWRGKTLNSCPSHSAGRKFEHEELGPFVCTSDWRSGMAARNKPPALRSPDQASLPDLIRVSRNHSLPSKPQTSLSWSGSAKLADAGR
jgi:SAM-dependent methyltransferase